MLVVISDLHMEEEASLTIDAGRSHTPLQFSRNLKPEAYQLVIANLAAEAKRSQAQSLDLVLAGDILDINRTSLWHLDNRDGLRPYVDNREVGVDLEEKVLGIIAGISAEPNIRGALDTLVRLSQGQFFLDGTWQDFPVKNITFHYLPGNHDRLANATPSIRKKVQEILGLPASDKPFPNYLFFTEENTLVRHGHEYDVYNFAGDVRSLSEIPRRLPADWVNAAPFGDFITVNVASRLPSLLREMYEDEEILGNDVLRTIYQRMIDFDILRPRSAMLAYMLHTPDPTISDEAVWKVVSDVIEQLLEEIYDHPFLRFWLHKFDKEWQLDPIDAVQAILDLRAWRWLGVPLTLAEMISGQMLQANSGEPHPEMLAAKETVMQNRMARFVIGGHTHWPKMALLDHDERGERYYIDSGTWRNRVPANRDFTAFGRLKTLTYVVVYGADEDVPAGQNGKIASVDAWTGFTQRW